MKHAYRENGVSLPWESYHRAVEDARLVRARLLRELLSGVWVPLKRRICCRARRWSEHCCPQCC
jgi:hypothetical protein